MAHESYGFESGNNDNWEFIDTPGPVDSTTVHSGTYSYDAHASGGIVYRPNAQYGPGTEFNVWWYPGGIGTDGSVIAGFDPSTQERYELLGDSDTSATDTIVLRYHDGTTETVLDSTAYEITHGEWHRLHLSWEADGTLTGILYDATDTALVTLTGTDTTITAQRSYGFWSNNGNNYFDDVSATTLTSQQTLIEDFETDRTAYYQTYSNQNYSRSTNQAKDGTTSMWFDNVSGGFTSITGMGKYPGPGDYVEFFWYPTQLTATFQFWYGYQDPDNRYLIRHDIDTPTDEFELGEKIAGTTTSTISPTSEDYQANSGWYRTLVYWGVDDTHQAWVFNPAGEQIATVSRSMPDTGGHGIGFYKSGGGDSVYVDAISTNPDYPITSVAGMAAVSSTPTQASGNLLEGQVTATPAPASATTSEAFVHMQRTGVASAPNPVLEQSDGLLGYYSFDSAENTEAVPNWVNRSKDAQMYGSVTREENTVRTDGVSFPGADTQSDPQRITAPSLDFHANVTDGITTAAWIKPRFTQPYNGIVYHTIAASGRTNSRCFGLRTQLNTTPEKVQVLTLDSGAASINVDNPDTWMHVVGVQTQTATRLYIDGQLHDELTHASVPFSNAEDYEWTIGNEDTAKHRWFEGEIDEVAVWNRALTPEEIETLYDGYVNGPTQTTITAREFTGIGDASGFAPGHAQFAPASTTVQPATGFGIGTPRPAEKSPTTSTATTASRSQGATIGTATHAEIVATDNSAHGTGAGYLKATPCNAVSTARTPGVDGEGTVSATKTSMTGTTLTSTPTGINKRAAERVEIVMTPNRATVSGTTRAMNTTTPYQGYEIPEGGIEEWHHPLNANFNEIDTDAPLLTDESDLPSVSSDNRIALTRDSRLFRVFEGLIDTGEWQTIGGIGKPDTPSDPVYTTLPLVRTRLEANEKVVIPSDYMHTVPGPYELEDGAELTIEDGGIMRLI